jgi:hypothetical protein
MKLEQQVCSLELAKKLKELGVYQGDAINWWIVDIKTGEVTLNRTVFPTGSQSYSAFTVAELGEMLPEKVNKNGIDYFPESDPTGKIKTIKYARQEDVLHDLGEFTEADARAKMLLYLLENGLITL